eukprot:6213628-Pleurochrysis_carterae.AAC.4
MPAVTNEAPAIRRCMSIVLLSAVPHTNRQISCVERMLRAMHLCDWPVLSIVTSGAWESVSRVAKAEP